MRRHESDPALAGESEIEMIRQYNPGRFVVENGRRVGTIPVGSVVRCSDGRRNQSWIVEAWLPRAIGAGDRRDGRYLTTYAAGGHLAVVRHLGNGARATLADHHLRRLLDED
jgi:hypothetical protein